VSKNGASSEAVGTLARQCHDCNDWLNEGAGWIVTPDYPAVGTVVGMLGKVEVEIRE
jgi:hypothetical protein